MSRYTVLYNASELQPSSRFAYTAECNPYIEFLLAVCNQYKREMILLFIAFDILLGLTLFSDLRLHVFKGNDTVKASAAVSAAANTQAPTVKSPVAVAPTSTVIAWPLQGHVTAEFGERTPYQRSHSGIDVSSYQRAGNTEIVPIRAGTIIEAGRAGGLGNRVVIDHGEGIVGTYAHLDSISVNAGQSVNATSVIGKEGDTGNTTGPHLHLEIRKNGQLINPRDLLDS